MVLPSDHPDGTPPAVSGAIPKGAADWLCLAAAPTFAIMGLMTASSGGGDMLCMGGPNASPLDGMALMYLLMTAFHLTPWLKLVTRRTERAVNGLSNRHD